MLGGGHGRARRDPSGNDSGEASQLAPAHPVRIVPLADLQAALSQDDLAELDAAFPRPPRPVPLEVL
jgi:hypothetical protein